MRTVVLALLLGASIAVAHPEDEVVSSALQRMEEPSAVRGDDDTWKAPLEAL